MKTQLRCTTEGRAFAARPSVCVFLALAALVISALLAPAAMAKLDAPTLTGTSPASPGTALRPSIKGDENVISTVVGPRSIGRTPAFGGPIAHVAGAEDNLITIYADDSTCGSSASIVATGTVAELEDAGIQVEVDVASDAVTRFYATLTDLDQPTEPSECSNGIEYQQVSTPPGKPSFTATVPASPADENQPRLIGTAAEGSTVEIYASPDCSGSPLASAPAELFEGAGITVGVADNTTTTFHASATLAGFLSGCSSSTIVYQEVSTTGGPGGEEPPGGGGQPGGGGESPGGGTGKPPIVTPPVDGKPLPDPVGKPPSPTLRTVPAGFANDNTPVVSGKAPGAAKVQVFGSAGCKGPVLAEGPATEFVAGGFEIEVSDNTVLTFYGVSIDGGGDHSPCSEEPAVYVEDSTAPHTRITAGPSVKTRKRTVLFRFADVTGDPSTSFLCRLDKRKWKSCQAPLKLKHLGHKRHLLRVKATDAAGNVEQGAAKRSFKVVGAAK